MVRLWLLKVARLATHIEFTGNLGEKLAMLITVRNSLMISETGTFYIIIKEFF
jgi:hypothetical protein